MAEERKVEEPEWLLKKKCVECVKGANLIRTLIIVICVAIVLKQISKCIQKLFVDIPITTYTHFDFNKSIVYPSLTFCREPPYKHDKLLEYGLYSHPRFLSTWISFNFSEVSLDELWDEITYNDQEMFVQYGLGGFVTNVKLTSQVGFNAGRCYTISPVNLNAQATKTSGYSITLKHSAADVETTNSFNPPGYHVYIHYTREPYTEVEVYNGGLVDHLYVNVGESLDVKLKVDEYIMISSEEKPCSHKADYSANICTAQYVWDKVGEMSGCSGPWMNSDLPRCNNDTAMRSLITAYMSMYADHNYDSCPRFCHSYFYNAYVTDRQNLFTWDMTEKRRCASTGDAALQTQNPFSSVSYRGLLKEVTEVTSFLGMGRARMLSRRQGDSYFYIRCQSTSILHLYFNSMMVSVYEDRYTYDLNLFISDLGGSIGFLLGLSVIGLINFFGKAWILFIRPYILSPKVKKASISDSISTVDVIYFNGNQTILEKQGLGNRLTEFGSDL